MKRIGLLFREISEKRIRDNLKSSSSLFIVKYSGLSSPDLSLLRQSLKSTKAELFVIKNSIAKRALKDLGFESLIKSIEGPCGLIFVKEEPVDASKVLYNFNKGHEQLKIEGGFLKDKVLQRQDIEAMAKLPSREVLRAQIVMTLNAPISMLAMVLNQALRKFVYCLDQIKQKKSTVNNVQQSTVKN